MGKLPGSWMLFVSPFIQMESIPHKNEIEGV